MKTPEDLTNDPYSKLREILTDLPEKMQRTMRSAPQSWLEVFGTPCMTVWYWIALRELDAPLAEKEELEKMKARLTAVVSRANEMRSSGNWDPDIAEQNELIQLMQNIPPA